MKEALLRIRAVTVREISSSLASPAAWVFLILFLILSGLCTFVVSDILAAGQADLSGFFNWMPWLFLILVPALGMPLWAEERRTGAFELTLSYPVTLWELTIGKYLAGMALLLAALVLTFPVPATIYYLGEPDTGAVLCGYFGALMIGSAFLAVSSFCSALTKSQTASFLLSLMFCSFLVFTGWDRISGILRDYLPSFLTNRIADLTIIPHYQAFQRGLLDTSEIVYCLSVTLLFLYCTKSALAFSSSGTGNLFAPGTLSLRKTWKSLGRLAGGLIYAFLCFFCAIYTADGFRVRLDCTSDKAYSLSPLSGKVVSALPRVVSVRLYITPDSAAMSGTVKQYSERVRWLLTELSKSSKGKIKLQIIEPELDSDAEEAALLDGIRPVRTPTGDRFYFGIAISSRERDDGIPYLFHQEESQLEYQLIRKMINVTADKKKLVGVMSEFPLLGRNPEPQSGIQGFPAWHVFRDMADDYQFCEVPLEIPAIPDEIDVLLIVHPSTIGKRGQYAIDQYLLRGGKLAIFTDPRSSFAEASARKNYSMMDKVRSNLPDLFAAWGIGLNPETMAADLQYKFDHLSSSGVRQTLPSALRIPKGGISAVHPLTRGLESIWMNFAGLPLVDNPVNGLKYQRLVFTSENAKTVPVTARQDRVFAEFEQDKRDPLPLGWHISGIFPGAYPAGAPDAAAGEKNPKHLVKSAKPSEVFVFADSDMLFHDACIRRVQDEFGQELLLRRSDNMILLQNVLEHLSGNLSLADLRSRVPMNRPMEKIRALREKADVAFRNRILTLLRDYQRENQRVEAIRRTMIANPGKVRLTVEQRELLENHARKEAEFKREVKNYKNQLKAELDMFSLSARFWNIIFVPAAVAFLGIFWSLFRRFKWRRRS